MSDKRDLMPVVFVPTAGYLFTYYNSKLSKEREAQIDRVNAQVGPGLHRHPKSGCSMQLRCPAIFRWLRNMSL